MKKSFLAILSFLLLANSPKSFADARIIRISEIEVDSKMMTQYLDILKTEAAASVKLEPGVIAIFPMTQKESPTSVRILEIYASKTAYEAHLQTPHFKEYKSSTQAMVKSLRLIDMNEIDPDTMAKMFEKLTP
jgi:quinol monooxygenase YgiN